MRTTTTIAFGVALLLAAATACSGGTGAEKVSVKPTEESAAAKPSPSVGAPRPLGKPFSFTTDGATMVMTVLAYEQGKFHPQRTADEEFGTTGYTWAAVEIKACLKNGVGAVTRFPWALAYANGARIKPSGVTYDDFPKPEYPYARTLKPGGCVRGKTVFAVPAKQRPESVLYTSTSLEKPAEWLVPQT
ncbi:hypothetical protein [Streptomyces geranii]|uniref:hypothetical protein n=1 Tax=Streptomyces geranii TaxID=2058923 RepID=UPI000D042B79|nr:hypothetical protein [Streptomyces geranii]